MKLVQVTFRKTVQKSALVVVEVPNDYPEEQVESMLTREEIENSTQGDWVEEESAGEALTVDDVMILNEGDGSPHFRWENDVLVRQS